MRRIVVFFTFFLFLSFGWLEVTACSCKGSNPPCGGVSNSSMIFSAEVIKVTTHPEERTEKYKEFLPFIGTKAKVKVLEVFNNVKVKKLTVETGIGGGDCGYQFQEGEQYLIYARENKGRILTSICSRTQLLSKAQDEVEILRELKSKMPVKPRVFGNVSLINREDDYSAISLQKVKISVKNDAGNTYQTETDLNGSYRLIDLPFGKYTIQATYKTNFIKKKEVEINEKSGEQCAESDFYFYEGGRISGKVVDSYGNPISRLRIIAMELKTSEGEETDWNSHDGYTDKNGNYEIEGLPNGKYYLGFNFYKPIKKEFPYPPMFYPQGKTKEEAARFQVTDESSLNERNFVISKNISPRLIKGTVKLLNGKNAVGARLRLKEEKTTWEMDSAEIDDDGTFTLSAFEGESYYIYFYESSYASGLNKDVKKIYIPKTGEFKEMEVILPIYGKIEGIITDENGKLIEEAVDVFLQCSNASGFSEEKVREWKGTFSFPFIEGCKYKAYAKFTYGKFEGLKSEMISISKDDIGKQIKFIINTKKK